MNFARFVFSQSCAVFFSVVSRRLPIISLMLSLSDATSPAASTSIARDRSPLVTAVATSAMARTCVVRFAARRLTLSVRSRQVPAAPGTLAWPPSLPSMPTSRATPRHLIGEGRQRVDHAVDRLGELLDLSLGLEHELALEVAVGDVGDDARDAAHLVGQVVGHEVDVVGQVLPRAGDALHLGLAAELALRCRPRAPRASLRRRTCRADRPSC